MISLPPETEALARRLADMQSVSVEDAIRLALEARASAAGVMPGPSKLSDRFEDSLAARRARMDQHVREIAAMPVLDPRLPAAIMDELDSV